MGPETTCARVDNPRDLGEILKTRPSVIALFYASWCPFCARFLPVFQRRAEKGGVHFVAVQDDGETLAGPYGVNVYPTVLFFKKGVLAKRLDGASGVGLQENQLTEFVDTCS